MADNPYLAEFYADMRRWVLPPAGFLSGPSRPATPGLGRGSQSAIADRSIYEDAYIFTRALHHLGNLNERDYLSYRTLYDLVVGGLPRPDLLLYLRAPVPLLLERIQRRGREIESGIDAAYLTLLESFYDDWMRTFDLCPVLTIQTGDLDFVHKPHHLDIVVQRIQERLAGKESIIFPNGGNGP
ncbi:MAG: deoxynucleoside kinase [Microthrixaceae bacterium]